MGLCRISKTSDVLLPWINPNCDFESIRFSDINFSKRSFKIAENNFPKHGNNEILL